MTPDQEALLSLFKSDYSPDNQALQLLEKLERWSYEYWNKELIMETNVDVEQRQEKLDCFLNWFKDKVANEEKSSSSLIHDDLYVKIVSANGMTRTALNFLF